MTHICVSKLTIIGSDNGLSPGRRQAIIRTNAGILLIRSIGTNFSEILNEIYTFSFEKMHLKMPFAKWRPFWPSLNVLTYVIVKALLLLTACHMFYSTTWLLHPPCWLLPASVKSVQIQHNVISISQTKNFPIFNNLHVPLTHGLFQNQPL